MEANVTEVSISKRVTRQAQLQREDLEALAAWATEHAEGLSKDESFSVSTGSGSGIVHIAPAFGADDYELSKEFDLPMATRNLRWFIH